MANTYSQIYIHYVFSVKGRENLIHTKWRNEVFKYISGIIKGKNQKSIIINGTKDHVHILVGITPNINISDLIRDIKNNSAKFINENNFLNRKFEWQVGYGVFSYSHSQINNVYKYIQNQEEHHKIKTFKDEYIELLQKFEIDFNEKYLFEWFND